MSMVYNYPSIYLRQELLPIRMHKGNQAHITSVMAAEVFVCFINL